MIFNKFERLSFDSAAQIAQNFFFFEMSEESPFAKIEPNLSSWKTLNWENHLFDLLSGIEQMTRSGSNFAQVELFLKKLILHSEPLRKCALGKYEWIKPRNIFCAKDNSFVLAEENQESVISIKSLYDKVVKDLETEAGEIEENQEMNCECFKCIIQHGRDRNLVNWSIVRVCILYGIGYFFNMPSSYEDGISYLTVLELLESAEDASAVVELAWSRISKDIEVLDENSWTADEYEFITSNNENIKVLERFASPEVHHPRACILLGLLKKITLEKYKDMSSEEQHKRDLLFLVFLNGLPM